MKPWSWFLGFAVAGLVLSLPLRRELRELGEARERLQLGDGNEV